MRKLIKRGNTRSKSFRKLGITYFLIMVGIVVLIQGAYAFEEDAILENAFPTVDNFLEREDALYEGDYDKVEIEKYRDCQYMVFDSSGELVYTSKAELEEEITADDLKTGSDSGNRDYRSEAKLHSQNPIHVNDAPPMLGTSDGILSITTRQVKISQEECTLAFLYPKMTRQEYQRIIRISKYTWIATLAILVGTGLIFSLLISTKMKKSMQPLEEAIREYSEGQGEYELQDFPQELEGVVNDYKNMQVRLRQMKEAKERADRRLRSIMSGLVHDLKSPLVTIDAYAGELDVCESFEDTKEYAKVIQNRSQQCFQMLESLEAYSEMLHPDYTRRLKVGNFAGF